jgi:hypothetical protein
MKDLEPVTWFSDLWTKVALWQMNNVPWITTSRVLLIGYMIIIVLVAFIIVPASRDGVHDVAIRYLGVNTRLVEELLVPATPITLEERLRLDRERARVLGKYLGEAVPEGTPVLADNVRERPVLKGKVYPLVLDGQPDLQLLNQGTILRVWIGKDSEPQRVEVLAIVPSGDDWVALLDTDSVKLGGFNSTSQVTKVQIESLPSQPIDLQPLAVRMRPSLATPAEQGTKAVP